MMEDLHAGDVEYSIPDAASRRLNISPNKAYYSSVQEALDIIFDQLLVLEDLQNEAMRATKSKCNNCGMAEGRAGEAGE